MSEEQLKAFLEKAQSDTSLQKKLKAVTDADALVEIAKESGFSISADDLKKAQSEVSDEELENASGGPCRSSQMITIGIRLTLYTLTIGNKN